MSEQPPAQSELRAQLQKDAGRKRKIVIGIVAALAVAAIAIVAGIFIGNSNKSETGADRIKVRVAIAEDRDWYSVAKDVAAEKGLDIDWVATDDWILPNTELVAGSVDANAFQHILYLSAFNAKENASLTPVFSTHIVQWGIFSDKFTSLDDLKDGATLLIPDDLSNGARALYILEAAGLIEIDDNAGLFPTVDDISKNPKNIVIKEVKALSISQLYSDPTIDGAVVGLSYFDPAQNVTADTALYLDDPKAESNLPYVNVVAVNKDNVDNKAWKILAEVYQDQRVKDAIKKEFGDTLVAVDIAPDELRAKLAELEDIARAKK